MKPRIYCAHCNTELRWGDKFCGHCGKPVEFSEGGQGTVPESSSSQNVDTTDSIACPTCGIVNKAGAERCRNCGASLQMRAPSAGDARSAAVRQAQKGSRPAKQDVKSPAILSSWKPIAAVAVIVVAAIAIEMYSSKSNIPTEGTQQQAQQPQQPTGANMSALSQIQDMEQAVKANPGNLEMVLNLANFLSDNRFYDKAITYYKKYLDKKPGDTNARVDMGICYKETGSYDDAVREMKKALEYDPKHLFATFNLGIVMLDEGKMYMDQGQMSRANELITESNDWFRKTVALAPASEVGKRAQQLLTQHSNTQLPQSN